MRRPKILFASYGHTRTDPGGFRNSCLLTNFSNGLGCHMAGDVTDISPPIPGSGIDWPAVGRMVDQVTRGFDVLWCQAGVALPVMQRFRELNPNALIILQRDSTHAATHLALMKAAMKRHGVEYEHHYEANGNALLNRELDEYSIASKIFVLSRWVKASFEENGLGHKVVQTASQVVDLSLWNRVGGKPVGEGRFTACFVGSLGLRKGTIDLLDGWRIFHARHPDSTLFLGGLPDGAEPKKVHDMLAEHGSSIPGVRWMSWLSPPEGPRRLYGLSDVYITAAVEEGSCMPGAESPACGLPIIATPNAGIDLLEHGVTGFEVTPADPLALSDALEEAYMNRKKLSELGAEARRRVQSQGVNDFAAGCARAIREVLS